MVIWLMERSLKTGPGHADQYMNFGEVLKASGLLDRALALLREGSCPGLQC